MLDPSMARRLLALITLSSLLEGSVAWGQAEARATAHDHYEKGLAAFDDDRFDDADREFEAAYRISPAFAVLYNIGRVNVALGRSVEAVEAFEKYLGQGAAAIPAERRRDVRSEIDRQRARIGSVMIRTAPESADVRVDGKLIGKTPLPRPVLFTAGRHTIEVARSGYAPQVRELDVDGMAHIEMDLRLDATVAAESPSPSAPKSLEASPAAPFPTTVQIVLPATAPPPLTAAPPTPAGTSNPMRTWGYAVAVVGLIAGGTGSVVALTGVSAANGARDRAASATAPTASAQADYAQAKNDFEAAKSQTQLGWMIAGLGAGVLVAGAILVVISPDTKAGSALRAFAPWISANGGGIEVAHAW